MPKQERMPKHEHKESSRQYEYTAEDAKTDADQDTKKQKVAEGAGQAVTDELLAEIDEILEVTEQTAINFQQQGGQ